MRRAGKEPGVGKKRPPARRRKARPAVTILIAAAVPVVLIAIYGVAVVWTDVAWFDALGYTNVYWTRIWARLALGGAGGMIFLAVFFSNVMLARRLSPRIRRVAGGDGGADILELVPTEDRIVQKVLLAVSLVLAFFFALGTGGLWQQVLLLLYRTPFGYTDPIFGRDASFFVFTLPVIGALVSFLGLTLVLTFIGALLVYVFDRAAMIDERKRLRLAPHVKGHLSSLAAGALLLKAAGYVISAWELVLSPRGVVFGASYADVHAELPVLRVLAAVSLISAIIFLVNIHYRGWRLPIVAVGLLVFVWIAAGQIYPAVVQQYRVSPNEARVERPYIEENIAATRWAYGLNKITSRPFPAEGALTPTDIEANQATIDNIRLWDPRPLLSTLMQIQEIRLYYTFRDVDVDRYVIDGQYRQAMLAARELDQSKLQPESKTWVNLHLTYTHGYGAVVARVNAATGEGLPDLFVLDIPPRSRVPDLNITEPRIYYGELDNDFILVNTDAEEFDYPKGDTNVTTTYEGTGGLQIGSLPRKLAFTLRFGTLKMLLSDSLTSESRILFRRAIQERVQTIAPFLSYDRDPYLVIRDDGSLVWIWDAYTTSTHFPYSQPRANGVNYIRNSIKVVVDAYNGDVTFYQIDPDDAIATTLGKVYPGLFVPGDQLPEDLRRHLRYPEDLFSIQANVLAAYHMTDPQVFYTKEDLWEIPTELYANDEVPVVPYYVIMALPGEAKEEFLLLQPFVPLQKKNMASWLAARMDGDHYGELVVFDFPKDKLVFGTAQIEARISNDPDISAQLTLWNQSGSQVIRGNLLVIPIEDSVIYVEPVYLQSTENPIPQLPRVIVAYADRVVMEPTLTMALEAVFEDGGAPTTPPTTQPPGGTTTTTLSEPTTTTTAPVTTTLATTTTTLPGAPLPPDAAGLAALAEQHYQAAQQAQRAGDWAEYGRQIAELGRVLEALKAATGQ